jgi:tRNA 2-thiouridine synthesizing protein A
MPLVALWRSGSDAGNRVRQRRAEFKPTTEASTVDFDKELDARGLSCPLPILKTKKSLNELTSGQVLKVVATDPGSIKDMQAFATQTGNPLLSTTEENKTYVFYLKKK